MPAIYGSEPFAHLNWNRKTEGPIKPATLEQWGTVQPPGRNDNPQGHLYLGESARVMTALLDEYEGQIDLIYLDPPFLSGNAYRARIGRNEDSRRPDEWETIRGYQDTWEDGADYLDMLYTRLELMYRLLAPTGSLYLHLDWHASAYGRVMLDEIFGTDRLLNEIIWVYHGPSPIKSAFNRKHDTILVYTKSKDYTFNADDVRIPYKQSTIDTFASSPKAGFGKKPNLQRGKVPEDWWYFPVVARLHSERTGYPTQKPEALMERIILASTNPGDLVADFFAGSGTTASVATSLERRWIACDAAPLSFATTYRRLLLNKHLQFMRLWVDEMIGKKPELKLELGFELRPDTTVISLDSVTPLVKPAIGFPDEITIIEIDWEYDGTQFKSRAQAVRGWRDERISLQFDLGHPIDPQAHVAMRAFDNRGRYGLAVKKLETE